MRDLSAFVLAGGRSRRMGSDKAFVEFEGRTLLERALELLRGLTSDVRIVGPAEKFASHGPVVEDVYPGQGPLAGIHAALSCSAAELNLIIGVDLALLTAELLRFIVGRARAGEALVTVPRIAGGFQPLCAVYRRDFAQLADAALKQGNNKIDALFSIASTRVIEEDELRQFAFTATMFENLNTPEDLRKAREHERPSR